MSTVYETFEVDRQCPGCGDMIQLLALPDGGGPEILDDQGELVKCDECNAWAHPECIIRGFCTTCDKKASS